MAREMKQRKEREPCNFCEFSRAGYGCGSQDNDAELQREVEKLRSLIKRISGKDDTLTFTEIVSVENHLKDVCRILHDQKKKVELEEDERLRNQVNKEAEDTSRSQVVPKMNAPLLKIRRHFEIRNAESLQTEFDRLWLLNERMNGRELDGMNSFDLNLLNTEISRAMLAFINQKSYPMMEQMARQSKDVDNKEPIKIIGALRLLCDFCGFFSNNRYEQSPHSQEEASEAMLSMESQFKRLKLSTRRMTCQDLDGLSFNELLLLETHLNAVWPIVRDQKKKIKEEEDQKNEDDGLGSTRQVFSGSSSSGERQEQQHGEAPLPVMSRDQIEFERQSAASMEIKFEKLWLLKERMNGRELEGMNSAELQVLEDRIIQALEDVGEHRLAPTLDRLAKKHREENDVVAVELERCSLGQRQG